MIGEDRKPFISWTYDPVINRDRANIILDMLRFIQEGTRDDLGLRDHSSFALVENAVKAALYEATLTPFAKRLPKQMLNPAGDTLTMVADAFLDQKNWIIKGAPVGAFRCADITDDLQQRLNTFWHPEVDEVSPTLATAFEVTFSNLARANSRLILMHVIPQLLQLQNMHQDKA